MVKANNKDVKYRLVWENSPHQVGQSQQPVVALKSSPHCNAGPHPGTTSKLQDRRDYTPADRAARTCWLRLSRAPVLSGGLRRKTQLSPRTSTWPPPPRPHLTSPKVLKSSKPRLQVPDFPGSSPLCHHTKSEKTSDITSFHSSCQRNARFETISVDGRITTILTVVGEKIERRQASVDLLKSTGIRENRGENRVRARSSNNKCLCVKRNGHARRRVNLTSVLSHWHHRPCPMTVSQSAVCYPTADSMIPARSEKRLQDDALHIR
ncbi:hypothetical protein TNCV_4463601 [Trichonephila clavipes]|nr:hypothetical protein TNCV_4463601 [Trichonephila clavipes]